MSYFLKVCLWSQVFAFIFALVAFAGLGDPRLAGSMTGPVFLLSGALPVFGLLARRISFRQISLWVSLVFTLFFSGPMLLKRFIHYGEDFANITYYGISSGLFHRLSSVAYLVLFAALIFDLWKLKKSQK